MSTVRTASMCGRGGSTPKGRGTSPVWTHRRNRFSAVSSDAPATTATARQGYPRASCPIQRVVRVYITPAQKPPLPSVSKTPRAGSGTIVGDALHRPILLTGLLVDNALQLWVSPLAQLEGTMHWRNRSKRKETFYSIGWFMRDDKSTLFREVPLLAGEVLRIMDKRLHTAALESAGRKLKELRHKSGTREAGL